MTRLMNHQKTVTSVCFDGTGTRLFSGSLDHQVKIYDLDLYQVSHSIKYTSPILDLGISVRNNQLIDIFLIKILIFFFFRVIIHI